MREESERRVREQEDANAAQVRGMLRVLLGALAAGLCP